MNLSKQLAAALLAGVLMAIGCSQGASLTTPQEVNTPLPAVTNQSNNHQLLGLYTFICDPAAESIDIIPLRETQLHLNALRLLEPPTLVNLTIEGKPKFDGNILDVDIGLRNPYLLLNQYTGFVVCGIVFTHGSLSGFSDSDIVMASDGDTRLLNADGYTRWWNPSEFPHGDNIFSYTNGLLGTPAENADFNCTINGYKYFADGLGKDDPLTALSPTNRGVFSAGAKNIRHYKFDLSGGLTFNYAIDACWKKPTGKPPYKVPDDFPPDANRPEAWNMRVTEVENTLYFLDHYKAKGGKLRLSIDVYDHFDASINKIYGESLAGLPLTSTLTPVGGGQGYSTYELDFTGEHLNKNGEIEIYLSIMSEVQGYGGLLPGKPICAYFKYRTLISGEPKGWVRSWGGTTQEMGYDLARGVITDPSYNVYVTGWFEGTTDLDPGEGIDGHSSNGHVDAFLSKFDPLGNLLWARTWGGTSPDCGNDVCIDSKGCVYVIGGFASLNADFDPGPGTDIHSTNGIFDTSLSKFDANGNFLWALTWGGTSENTSACGAGVAVDSFDNVYATGCFGGTGDLDPGPGTDYRTAETGYDIYISKFDPDGDYQWALTDGGPWNSYWCYNQGEEICLDAQNNIYITGGYCSDMDFDPGVGIDEHSAVGLEDIFISKFSMDGEFQWARTWGSEGDDSGMGVAVDKYGNVYATGWFSGIVDFDPGPGVDEHMANGSVDGFVSKFDTSGNFTWARTWGGNGIAYHEDAGYGVAVGDSGIVSVAGTFSGSADFDPGPGVDEHESHGGNDILLIQYDSTGGFLSAYTCGSKDDDQGFEIACDDSGIIHFVGVFCNTVDFDPGFGIYECTSNGGRDSYLCKFPPDGNW